MLTRDANQLSLTSTTTLSVIIPVVGLIQSVVGVPVVVITGPA